MSRKPLDVYIRILRRLYSEQAWPHRPHKPFVSALPHKPLLGPELVLLRHCHFDGRTK